MCIPMNELNDSRIHRGSLVVGPLPCGVQLPNVMLLIYSVGFNYCTRWPGQKCIPQQILFFVFKFWIIT